MNHQDNESPDFIQGEAREFDINTYVFSASSVDTYNQCKKKFKLEKIDRIKAPFETTHYRWLGRLVHNAIYSTMGTFTGDSKGWELRDTIIHPEMGVEVLQKLWDLNFEAGSYYENLYHAEVKNKPIFARKKALKSLDTDDQEALERGWNAEARKMVMNGAKVIRDGFSRLIELEKKLEYKMFDRNFVGYVDILAYDDEGQVVFLDFKTSWNKVSKRDIQEDIQFISYSYALKEILGLDYYPKGYLVHLRSGGLVEFEMDDYSLSYMFDYVRNTFKNMESGVFFSSWGHRLCPYCDFYKLCKREIEEW